MSKLLLFLSFIGLAFLITGSILFPGFSAMWLASTTAPINIFRSILALVLLALMVTEPPRNAGFRTFVAFLAVGTGVWGAAASYNNIIPILDGASLLLASVSMGTVVLEFRSGDMAEEAYNEAAQAAITRHTGGGQIPSSGSHAI